MALKRCEGILNHRSTMRVILSSILFLSVHLAAAHCEYLAFWTARVCTQHLSSDTFPDLYANGTVSTDWQYVRLTANHYDNGPVRHYRFGPFFRPLMY